MSLDAISILNICAAILWFFLLIPQAIVIIKTKKTYDLKYVIYFLFLFSNLGMFGWAIANIVIAPEQLLTLGTLLSAFTAIASSLTVIGIKYWNNIRAKKLGITEEQFWKKTYESKKK